MARRNEALKALNEAPSHPQHLCKAEYQGLHCQYFWVVSESTHGGQGWCNQHVGMKFGERFKQIIEESHQVMALYAAKKAEQAA